MNGNIPTGASVHAIAFSSAGTVAYVTNQTAGNVSVINTSTRTKLKDTILDSKP